MSGNRGGLGEEAGEACDLVAGGRGTEAQHYDPGELSVWIPARVCEVEVGGDETAVLIPDGLCDVGIRVAGEALVEHSGDVVSRGSQSSGDVAVDVLVELDLHDV